jgi:hypothetical protein
MNRNLEKYQEIIDIMVERRPCVLAKRIAEENYWPEGAAHAKFNSILASLTPEQRSAVAELLQSARDGGMHDTLMVLSEKMNLEGLRFTANGEELPHEPYGTEIFFDWVARLNGEPWPNHEG